MFKFVLEADTHYYLITTLMKLGLPLRHHFQCADEFARSRLMPHVREWLQEIECKYDVRLELSARPPSKYMRSDIVITIEDPSHAALFKLAWL